MPQFDCPACGTTFRSFTILVNHMDSEHPNDYATHGDAVLEHVAVQLVCVSIRHILAPRRERFPTPLVRPRERLPFW